MNGYRELTDEDIEEVMNEEKETFELKDESLFKHYYMNYNDPKINVYQSFRINGGGTLFIPPCFRNEFLREGYEVATSTRSPGMPVRIGSGRPRGALIHGISYLNFNLKIEK